MSRLKSPKPEEILEVLQDRDLETHPLASTAWVSNQFPEVTRRTVYNRLEALVDRGLVEQYDFKNTNAWALDDEEIVPLGDGLGVCPECHGQLVRDEEYALGFNCRSCGAAYGQISDGERITEYGRANHKGAKVLVWWGSLPSAIQTMIITIVSALPERLRPNNPGDVEDRPENIVFNSDLSDVPVDSEGGEEVSAES